MSDKRTEIGLETRLSSAFRSTELPAAPPRLVEGLERVPESPVRGGAEPGPSGNGRRTIVGLLGVAAILLIGGTLAVGVGSRPSTPVPAPSGPRTGEPTSAPAVVVSYRVGWTDAAPYSAALLAEEVRIVQGRVDATGAVGVTASAVGTDRVDVAIPAGLDAEALRRLIGQTGHVAFVPLGDTQLEKGALVDPTKFPELFGSEGVATAAVSTGQTGARVVVFELTPGAADMFGSYTAAHIGSYFAITLDNLVVSAPVINSEIPGGKVEISQGGTGGWDLAAANELATVIRLKPLPAPLTEISNEPAPVDPSPSPSVVASPDLRPRPSGTLSEIANGAPVACEAVLDLPGPQLDCDSAVRAALAILPSVRPAIAKVTFSHTCFDPLNPDAAVDCAVQYSGIVQVTYVGGALPALIGVRIGENGERLAFLLITRRTGGPEFTLERTPGDFGCDAMPPPYQSFVIHIDANAEKPVWAIADTKVRLRVFWGAGDRGLKDSEPVVVDAFGRVLARDGTRTDVPDGAWPSLNGRFVCPGADAVYITDQPAQP